MVNLKSDLLADITFDQKVLEAIRAIEKLEIDIITLEKRRNAHFAKGTRRRKIEQIQDKIRANKQLRQKLVINLQKYTKEGLIREEKITKEINYMVPL